MIFDLDGTLVQTEKLKARSYAQAVEDLEPGKVDPGEVVEAYRDVVGLSREKVAETITRRFRLAGAAGDRLREFGASEPWQVVAELHMRHYRRMLADAPLLRRNLWPQTIGLLKQARRLVGKVGLASMSYADEVARVLEVLHLGRAFDFVASREAVKNGKPDPDIYLFVARRLEVRPADCLVIEDSESGVEAALAAGMGCIAAATGFTRAALLRAGTLDERWIVEDHDRMKDVVKRYLDESRSGPLIS